MKYKRFKTRRLGRDENHRLKNVQYLEWLAKNINADKRKRADKAIELFGDFSNFGHARRICIKCKEKEIAWLKFPRVCEVCEQH